MQQPRLFPDHEDTQAAPVFTAPQTVALIAVMSQIVHTPGSGADPVALRSARLEQQRDVVDTF